MQTDVNTTAKTLDPRDNVEPARFQKRIGSITFVVAVHFSQTNKETMEDKVLRLIESEVRVTA